MTVAPQTTGLEFTTDTSSVPVGLTRDVHHTYTWNDGHVVYSCLPSVTTVLRVLDKSGPLTNWAKGEVARCAIRNLDALVAMRAEGHPDAAINWLRAVPDRVASRAASRGTEIHRLAELIVRGEEPEIPEEVAGHVSAYRAFIRRWDPTFVAVEQMVASVRFGFGGTFDAVLDLDRERWLVDIKSGNGVYPEVALQLAAYGIGSQFLGRPGDPRKYRVPRPTRFGVVHVQADRAELIPVAVDRSTFDVFLRVLDVWRWTQVSRTVIGKPITREGHAA